MPAYNYTAEGGHLSSKYTILLKTLLDNYFDLGLDKYPIFDEKYRVTLNTKLINRYILYEIGWETPHLFKQRLNQVMEEIMPLYNQYYEADLYEIDPLTNYKSTENYDMTRGDKTNRADKAHSDAENKTDRNDTTDRTEDRTGESNKNTDTFTITNDTPQTRITRQNLNDGIFASETGQADGNENVTDKDNSKINQKLKSDEQNTGSADSTLDSNISVDTTQDYIRTLSGYRGVSPQYLLNELYDSFVNIDQMIIEHEMIKRLFMGVL